MIYFPRTRDFLNIIDTSNREALLLSASPDNSTLFNKRCYRTLALTIAYIVAPLFLLYDIGAIVCKALWAPIHSVCSQNTTNKIALSLYPPLQQTSPKRLPSTGIDPITSQPSELLAFYQNKEPNRQGVTLEEIIEWDDETLEKKHDYIQWLFPGKYISQSNLNAPLLDPLTIETFRNDQHLQLQLIRAFTRMLQFYGLKIISQNPLIIEKSVNFIDRAKIWLHSFEGQHNWLRITRILTALRTLGCTQHAKAFQSALNTIATETLHANPLHPIQNSLHFWMEAIEPKNR